MNLGSYPIEISLSNGKQVTIRPMEMKDGPGVLEFFRKLPAGDRLFLRDDVTTPEWLDRFCHQIDYNAMIPLVAEQGGKIVGNATISRTLYGWSTHVGELRIAVARPLQRRGLGTALARELVKIAQDAGLEKMVAAVVDNQMGAKRAFEKLGFRPEATLKGHVKDVHKIKRNLVIMTNTVSHIWEAMESLLQDYSPSHH